MFPKFFGLYFGVLVAFNVYWLLTYALVIRRGYLDKTWGIPIASLTLNLAWDFYGTFIVPSPLLQHLANGLFMICNLIITAQVFIYWRKNFTVSGLEFFGLWTIAQVSSLFIIGIARLELNDPFLVEIGFIDNFINSALFIGMFYSRDGLKGQSIYIALSKLIGTGAISLSWYLYQWNGTTPATMIFTTIGILILDLIYVGLVYHRAKEMKIDVWRRW